jgi:hypothetical protein
MLEGIGVDNAEEVAHKLVEATRQKKAHGEGGAVQDRGLLLSVRVCHVETTSSAARKALHTRNPRSPALPLIHSRTHTDRPFATNVHTCTYTRHSRFHIDIHTVATFTQQHAPSRQAPRDVLS